MIMIRWRRIPKNECGYKYQLLEDYSIETGIPPKFPYEDKYLKITADGTLTVKKLYAWDGATWAFDTKSMMRPSLVHDALYQLMRMRIIDLIYRWIVDRILCALYCYDADPLDTGGWFNRSINWLRRRFISCRSTWIYYGVRVGGYFTSRPADH